MFEGPPKIKKPDKDDFFESPSVHKERLNINGADIDAVSIKPKNSKTDVPVLVLPGWGATMESFKPGMKILAERERPVLSLDFPRKGGDILNPKNQDVEEWYKKRGLEYPDWPSEFLRQANTTLGLLDKEQIDKTDVIAHSLAGPSICIAAMLHPEKFTGRTIILINSAGLIGKDTLVRLAKGAGANTSRTETMKNIQVTETETAYLESTKHITPDYIKANPLRAVKEVWDISQNQIDEYMLRYLKEKGIKVIVVGAVEDTMFPMGTAEKETIIKEERIGEHLIKTVKTDFVENRGMQANVKADSIAGFVSTIGGHAQIQVHPEMFMSALESMLPQPKEQKD